MSVFNKTNSFGLPITAALLLGLLSGCGGGNSTNTAAINKTSGTSSNAGTGRVQLTIAWPPRTAAGTSRYIPPYAASLVLTLTSKTDPTQNQSLTINRTDDKPSTQTVAFPKELLVGTYVLDGIARADKDGNGTTVAAAATEVIVQSGQTANAPLTLASSISNLSIVGQPLQLIQGQTLTLSGKAVGSDGSTLLLPKGALVWSLVPGNTFGSVTADGVFTAIKAGVARVRLSEPGANLSAEADVTVAAKSIQASGLANSAWPKFRGNNANNGQSVGKGAVGTKKWEFGTGDIVYSSPAIGTDGTVYVGSYDDKVYALDGTTGAKKWEFATGSFVHSSPAIGADGTVYVGTDADKVYALNGTTGAKKWEFAMGNSAESSPAIGADGTVYVGSLDSNVYALDGTTGAKKWEFMTTNPIDSSPAIGADGTVYIGTDAHKGYFSPIGKVYALDGTTGAKKWEFATSSFVHSSPAIGADGTVYAAGTDGKVYALDGTTGAKRWEFATGGGVYSSPAIGADGTVYIGSSDDKVYALDGTTGAKKWEFGTGDTVESSPAIGADGTVYVGSYDNKVYALDGTTGAKKWEFTTGGGVYSSPAIGADGTVYIGSFDHKVYAIK